MCVLPEIFDKYPAVFVQAKGRVLVPAPDPVADAGLQGLDGFADAAADLLTGQVAEVRWRAPGAAMAVGPAAVPGLAQVRLILAEVARIRPELAAFFGCLYYAARRPEEAVALRRELAGMLKPPNSGSMAQPGQNPGH